MLKWFKNPDDKDSGAQGAAGKVQPTDAGAPGEKWGLFKRLKDRLSRTQNVLVDRLREVVGLKTRVDADLLEEIEEVLLGADIGVRSTAKILKRLEAETKRMGLEEIEGDVLIKIVKEGIEEILDIENRSIEMDRRPPLILLFVGVNGTGKTTTIGKLALEFRRQGKKVMLVAADTFRAAAIDQLQIWADRTDSWIEKKAEGSDPASVCHDALKKAREFRPDVVLIDTAGRLHTKKNLMIELSKVIRVIQGVYPKAPHETILVLDATTGQNAVNQVEIFSEAAQLTGLIMTKLDGTAKGGILVAIKEKYPLPIFRIGIGEAPEDLREFNAREFAAALFGHDVEEEQSGATATAGGSK